MKYDIRHLNKEHRKASHANAAITHESMETPTHIHMFHFCWSTFSSSFIPKNSVERFKIIMKSNFR